MMLITELNKLGVRNSIQLLFSLYLVTSQPEHFSWRLHRHRTQRYIMAMHRLHFHLTSPSSTSITLLTYDVQ